MYGHTCLSYPPAEVRGSSSFVPRALTRIVFASLLSVAVLAPATASAKTGSTTKSINDFLTMPGDQIVTVPDGTYSGSEVTAPHAETTGPYGGFLILVAEHQGRAVVDLSTDSARRLYLKPGTSRIAFVGFSFRNGVIRNEAESIRFWYCDHQDPDYGYLEDQRTAPRMLQTNSGGSNLQISGSDFHNTVATPVVFGSLVDNVTIQGVRIFAIDPRFAAPVDPASHLETMGSPPGSHKNIRVLDSYLEGFYSLWGTDSGSITDLTWQNIWYGYGYRSPFLLQSVSGRKVEHTSHGELADLRARRRPLEERKRPVRLCRRPDLQRVRCLRAQGPHKPHRYKRELRLPGGSH